MLGHRIRMLMKRKFVSVLIGGMAIGVALIFSASAPMASDDACPMLAGISKSGCTTPLKPTDFIAAAAETYWYDTDGVEPGIAGCHIGVKGPEDKTPNNRSFGEVCLSDVVLIESNPGKDKIHSHKGDIGAPYLVNCSDWCKGTGLPKGGSCKKVNGPAPCTASARCECN